MSVAETQKIKAETKLNYNIDTESGCHHIVNSTVLTLPGLLTHHLACEVQEEGWG